MLVSARWRVRDEQWGAGNQRPGRTVRFSPKTTWQATVFVEQQSLARATLLMGHAKIISPLTELLDHAMPALRQLKMGRHRADARKLALLEPSGTPIFDFSRPPVGTASLIACLPQYGTS